VSVTIDLNKLSDAVARRPFGYIITVDPAGEPHLRAVVPDERDGSFFVRVGKRSAANVSVSGTATMVWPPLYEVSEKFDDHSVIADCNATTVMVDGEMKITVTAHSAVWYRPARA